MIRRSRYVPPIYETRKHEVAVDLLKGRVFPVAIMIIILKSVLLFDSSALHLSGCDARTCYFNLMQPNFSVFPL